MNLILEDMILSIKEERKLRNTYRVNILNDIYFIQKFLTSSPGVIGPGKVEEKINSIKKQLKSPWITQYNKSLCEKLGESIEKVEKEFTERYLEMPKEEDTAVDVTDEVIESNNPYSSSTVWEALPRRTVSLFKDVEIRKGDVSYLPVGPCCHYCIIYKIVGETVYVIPLTTTDGIFEGYKLEKSRFFKGTAIYSLQQFPKSMVEQKFTMPFDHKSECNQIFKSFEETMSKVIKRKKK